MGDEDEEVEDDDGEDDDELSFAFNDRGSSGVQILAIITPPLQEDELSYVHDKECPAKGRP